jgi:teichuronic acid biosynthesis glycosyltransferase TuaC
MNVLVLSHMFPSPLDPCAGVFVLEQAKALRDAGVQVHVVSPTPWAPRWMRFHPSVRKYMVVPRTWVVDDFVVQYPRVPTLPRNMGFFLSGVLFYLSCRGLVSRLMQELRIDVIHAHTLLPDGFCAVLLGREFGIPVVCTAHGADVNVYPRQSNLARRASKWTLQHADHLIAVSENLKKEALTLGGNREITVVRNGAADKGFQPHPKTEIRNKLGLNIVGKVVTFIGYLRAEKGVDYLLQAFAILQHRDTHLCIVGDGPLRDQLTKQAKRLGILEHCIFAGQRPHSEIPFWISASDCVVLPSLSEGFPTILPEVMLCGVPIVATAVGGVPEAVRDQETGWLVPPANSSAIAQALTTLLSDEQVATRLAASAQKWAKQSLTWNANAAAMIKIYNEVVGRAGAATRSAYRNSPIHSLSIH